MGRVLQENALERGPRSDPELLAVQGLYACPACWAGEEICDACGGSGLLSVGSR